LNPISAIHAKSSVHELNKHILRPKLSLKDTYTQSNRRAGNCNGLPHFIISASISPIVFKLTIPGADHESPGEAEQSHKLSIP
jgi:hypothetical protein